MLANRPDISIIIVNYRVKEYLSLLLDSIKKAQQNLAIEIIVVDNNSQDDSVEYLSLHHENANITFIENKKNEGFGKANNQGLKKASGTYTLLINPDTVLENQGLIEMKNFMDLHNDCGVAGFKMINPDGSFARECRRSVPDLKSAIFRVLALDVIFPKNRVIGKRYLGWMSESEIAEVPVISGAGMFWRTSLLKELEGFDEDFFMYGEDDDLCYRVQETGYKIQYFPSAILLHFKGESERIVSIKYLKKINSGLIQFFKKHYQKKYNKVSKSLISVAFYTRILMVYVVLLIQNIRSSNKSELKSIILIGDKNKEVIGDPKVELISGEINIKETEQQLLSIQQKLHYKGTVVFDVSLVSYQKAFKLMEILKDRKMNFCFLLQDERKIIGKSTVIDL